MEPIFDKNGKTVGWLNNLVIHDRSATYRAFIAGAAVYDFSGRYLGRFRQGFFRDKRGNAVAFLKGARGGPLLPFTEFPPFAPFPPFPPLRPLPELPPLPPLDTLKWSALSFEDFLTS
jgi:sporulation protein YlmC with PRC-barrel domain